LQYQFTDFSKTIKADSDQITNFNQLKHN